MKSKTKEQNKQGKMRTIKEAPPYGTIPLKEIDRAVKKVISNMDNNKHKHA